MPKVNLFPRHKERGGGKPSKGAILPGKDDSSFDTFSSMVMDGIYGDDEDKDDKEEDEEKEDEEEEE